MCSDQLNNNWYSMHFGPTRQLKKSHKYFACKPFMAGFFLTASASWIYIILVLKKKRKKKEQKTRTKSSKKNKWTTFLVTARVRDPSVI